MARYAAVNPAEHRDLRVDTGHGAALGDAMMYAQTFPQEFRNVQSHYPIVFGKTGDGSFQPLALFGFRDGQNLFLDGERWDATYIPLTMQRQPFLIGAGGDALMLHVDLDHPRLATGRGEPLFAAHGGMSPYLDRQASVLRTIHDGLQQTKGFVDALLEHRLLESFVLDLVLADGAESRLSGFYTIDEERLRALDATAFGALGTAGHLEPAYMVLASIANLRVLIERANARVARDHA